jgi:hypothetical protein
LKTGREGGVRVIGSWKIIEFRVFLSFYSGIYTESC